MKLLTSIIAIGILHRFELLGADKRFGVFRKLHRDGSGRVTYLVAPLPPVKSPTEPEPPSSVLKEFQTEAEALWWFKRWKSDPLQTRPIERRKQRRQYDPNQAEFALGPYRSKQQLNSSKLHSGGLGT
jgi:hypothetical protein